MKDNKSLSNNFIHLYLWAIDMHAENFSRAIKLNNRNPIDTKRVETDSANRKRKYLISSIVVNAIDWGTYVFAYVRVYGANMLMSVL